MSAAHANQLGEEMGSGRSLEAVEETKGRLKHRDIVGTNQQDRGRLAG